MSNSFAINSAFSGAAYAVGKYAKPEPIGKAQDFKLSRIINKFKSGKKLTGGELAYLSANAPEIYSKVVRIMRQRQILEQRLAMARSDEEVAQILMNEMQSIEKMSVDPGDDFEKTARLNQTMNAYKNYLASKNNNGSEEETEQLSVREKSLRRSRRKHEPKDSEEIINYEA
jgi:hypothetical protein